MVTQELNYNYSEIGLKVGLEVHAQLISNRKLFCHCKPQLLPAHLEPDYLFERRFRPVLGEMGDFDSGMLVEFEKSYRVIYETFNDYNICTYEMDETPPFMPCMKTIQNGFKISSFFNCASPVDEIIFNRKQYLDGSIPTGFQRTAIIARDGFINLKDKNVRINNVLIEEDAARRVRFYDRSDRNVYFNLDRLGIPLTEIITNHEDCTTPEELLQLGMLIGLSLRILGVGKRGIGTIRQDVNISVNGGSRVELKGIQDFRQIKKYVDREIFRQLALLDIKNDLLERGINKNDFQPNFIDVSSATRDLTKAMVAFAVRLPKCKGIFIRQVQPEKTFSEELFDRCELIAGIPMRNMTHSDDPASWLDLLRINEVLNLHEKDAFVVIKGDQKSVLHALNRLRERMIQALECIPQETRRVNSITGNNEFLRVIHGKDRMYSDTDTPPISISDEIKFHSVDLIKPWELFANFPIDVFDLDFLFDNEFYSDFATLVKEYPENTRVILGHFQKISCIIHQQNLGRPVLSKHGYTNLIRDLITNKISKDSLKDILVKIDSGYSYDEIKEKYEFIIQEISLDQYRKLKVILDETLNSLNQNNRKKMFYVIKTHFPMLKSEQIAKAIEKMIGGIN
ncbi:Glu-tRNA(Gln) amidotransferase subunit GatE [Candidatus Hodarchaeum mangrovi]